MVTLQDELDGWAGERGGCADVAATIVHLAAACVGLARLLGQGPLARVIAAGAGRRGRGGDGPARLQLPAHELIAGALRAAPVATMLSRQIEEPATLAAGAPLAVAIDPLEGPCDMDGSAPLGTIFGVLAADPGDPEGAFRRPGTGQLAAGLVIYGPSTSLALTLGEGTDVFTLDPDTGRFERDRVAVSIPTGRAEYAVNAARYRHWAPPIRAYIDDCVAGADGPRGEDFEMRWTGSVVAEAFRILIRGGVCLYPADARPGHGQGGLCLVCQANPIAWLIEQAGGAATDGTRRILELVPECPHQQTWLVFGSRDNVECVRRYHEDPPFAAHRAPLFGRRGLFRA
jgi:fructose-1,6-bisphosphatase I